jgi:hypothetical protein
MKLIVLDHYSGGSMRCACCGVEYIEFLTIDHINGGGAKHRRLLGSGSLSTGGGHFYSWLKRNGYPNGYRVLCQNCNFSHGVFGYCPHDKKTDLLKLPMEIFQEGIHLRPKRDGLRASPEDEKDAIGR